jgi:hypothetical protein
MDSLLVATGRNVSLGRPIQTEDIAGIQCRATASAFLAAFYTGMLSEVYDLGLHSVSAHRTVNLAHLSLGENRSFRLIVSILIL